MIIFMRHGKMLPPYDNYESLTLFDLDSLGLRSVDPDVDSDFVWYGLKQQPAMRPLIENCDRFICSESRRTRQSCEIIMKWAGINEAVAQDSRLNEIMFLPSAWCGDYVERPLENLRQNLYQAVESENHNAEPRSSVLARLQDFFKENAQRNVFCVTHGFLMNYMKLYLSDVLGISVSSCLSADDHVPYLGIMNINVDNPRKPSPARSQDIMPRLSVTGPAVS